MKVVKGLLVLLFLMSMNLFADKQEDIIKGLMADGFRDRKAAYKEALKLSYAEMLKLVDTLKKSDDPELQGTSERLATHLADLKKNMVLDLPEGYSFKFDNDRKPFDSLSFKLICPTEDFKWKVKDFSLIEVKVDGKVFDANAISQFRTYARDNEKDKYFTWSTSYGYNKLIPEKAGKYTIDFIIQNPDGKWKKTFEFTRKEPSEEEAFSKLLETGLQAFLRREFYKDSHPDLFEEVLKFIKEFPKCSYIDKFQYNFSYALQRYADGKFDDEEYLKKCCAVINKLNVVSVLKRFKSTKDYEQKKKKHDIEELERIKLVESLLKWNVTDMEEKIYTVKIPEMSAPFQENLIVIDVKHNDYKYKNLEYYKVLLNGKEVYTKKRTPKKQRSRTNRDLETLTFDSSFIPNAEGTYKIEIFLSRNEDIVKLPTKTIIVSTPKNEVDALAAYKKLKNNSSLIIESRDDSLALDFRPYIAFKKKYPNSYLTKSMSQGIEEIVNYDLNRSYKFSEEQRQDISALLAKPISLELMKNFGSKISSSDKSTRDRVSFWKKFIFENYAKKALPEGKYKTAVTTKNLLPYEKVAISLEWKEESHKPSNCRLLEVKVNDESIVVPSSYSSSTSSTKKTLLYKKLVMKKPGTYTLDYSFLIDDEIYTFEDVPLKIVVNPEDQEAYDNLPSEEYMAAISNSSNYNFSFEEDSVYNFILKYPESAYAKALCKEFIYKPERDCQGHLENFTAKDRAKLIKVLNATSTAKAYFQLKGNDKFKFPERRKMYIKELKLKEYPAPKELICIYPKVLGLFYYFDFYVENSEDKDKYYNISKVMVGDTEISLEHRRRANSFTWKNIDWKNLKEGKYPFKVFVETEDGLAVINTGEVAFTAISKNKEAYETFCKSGIAKKLIRSNDGTLRNLLKDKEFIDTSLEFFKNYPNTFYANEISQRFSNLLTKGKQIIKLENEEIENLVTLLNAHSPALAKSRFDRALPKVAPEKATNLTSIGNRLRAVKDQKNTIGLSFSFRKKVLPYQQFRFDLNMKESTPTYLSMFKINDKTYRSKEYDRYYWEQGPFKKSWYFRVKLMKNIPREPGKYNLELCVNDLTKEYSFKSEIEIYLPESEKIAFEEIESSSLHEYFTEYRNVLWLRNNLKKEIFQFIEKYPKSKFLEVFKEKMIIDWHRAHGYYRKNKSETFFELMDIIDKDLSDKYRKEVEESPYYQKFY
ncbi:MAG: hypothetical protein NE330_01990 [Lentisphaeraceae bacterium]|nr:hypothetical protein [Lentisphaeraceae bacterium]